MLFAVISAYKRIPSAYIGVLIITFQIGFDTTCIGLAIPVIAEDIGCSSKLAVWLSIAYTAGFSAFLLPSGILSDRIGARKIVCIATIVFVVTSFVSVWAKDIFIFSILRLLQGISAAFLNTAAMALLNELFPPHRLVQRNRAFQVWSIVLGASFSLGPVLAGAIIALTSWKWMMWMNLPLGAMIIYLMAQRGEIGLSPTEERLKISLLSTLPLSIAILTLILGGKMAKYMGYQPSHIILPILVACFFFSFLMHFGIEKSVTRMSELHSVNFVLAMLLPVFFSIIFWSLFVIFPQFIHDVYAMEILWVSIIMLLLSLPIAITPVVKTFQRIMCQSDVLPIGFSLITIGLWLAAVGFLNHRVWNGIALVIGVIMMGIGGGLINPSLARIVMDRVSFQHSGLAAALTSTMRQSGFALGVALLSTLTDKGFANQAPFSDSLALVLISLIAILAIGLACHLKAPKYK